jgi:hypothetical protein
MQIGTNEYAINPANAFAKPNASKYHRRIAPYMQEKV